MTKYKVCDNCGCEAVVFINHRELYGREYSDWPYVYHCRNCDGIVGTQVNTNIPLGRIADKTTRMLRKRAHMVFDVLWQERFMPRPEAYKWLARKLDLTADECHMAVMSDDKLREVISLEPEIKKFKIRRDYNAEQRRQSKIKEREQANGDRRNRRKRKRKKYAARR